MNSDSLIGANGLEAQPIREITRDGVHYTLLGTAHVSRTSAEAVANMAGNGNFDAIAVELCAARLEALSGKKRLEGSGSLQNHPRKKGWPGYGQPGLERLPETHRRAVWN